MLTARETIGHGKFLPWLKAEFAFSVQTAHNMMNVAARLPAAKFQTVGSLPKRIVYALVAPSCPDALRAEVLDAETHDASQVQQRLEENRKLEPFPIALQSGSALSPCFDALSCAEPVSASAESALERERRAEAKLTPGQKKHRRKVAKSFEQEERARLKRVAEREANISQAVGMIRAGLGDEFPELIALIKKIDSWYFLDALTKALDPA